MVPRPRRISSERSRLHASSRRKPGSSAPPWAWRSSGAIRASDKRPTLPLTPIYGWFTEGFDTLDLREAKGVPQRAARLTRFVAADPEASRWLMGLQGAREASAPVGGSIRLLPLLSAHDAIAPISIDQSGDQLLPWAYRQSPHKAVAWKHRLQLARATTRTGGTAKVMTAVVVSKAGAIQIP